MVRYLKRLKSSRLGRVQVFPMYGGLGMSAPSLHRESTDSLIIYSNIASMHCFVVHISDSYILLHNAYRNSRGVANTQIAIRIHVANSWLLQGAIEFWGYYVQYIYIDSFNFQLLCNIMMFLYSQHPDITSMQEAMEDVVKRFHVQMESVPQLLLYNRDKGITLKIPPEMYTKEDIIHAYS